MSLNTVPFVSVDHMMKIILERVGKAGAVEVAVAEIEDLGLALEPPERSGVNDPRVVDVAIVARVLALRRPALAAG